MADEEKVVILTIRANAQGLDQAKQQLRDLGIQYQETDRAIVQQTASLDKLANRFNESYRIEQQYLANQEKLQRATQAYIEKGGDATKAFELYGTALSGLNQKHAEAVDRMNGAAGAAKGLAGAHDQVTGSAGKMREGMVLVHEFLRGDWKRAVGSATIELGNFGLMGYLLNPIVLGIAAVAGATAAWAIAAEHTAKTQSEMNAALLASGGAVGLSRSALDDLAHSSASASGQTVAGMRVMEQAYARTGKIGTDIFTGLVGITADYAVLAGVDLPKATEILGKAFADPSKGVKELSDATLHLTAAQIEHIQRLEESGQHEKAQAELLEAVTGKAKGLVEQGLTPLDRAWRAVKEAAEGAIGAMNRTPSPLDKLALAHENFNSIATTGQAIVATPSGVRSTRLATTSDRQNAGAQLFNAGLDTEEENRNATLKQLTANQTAAGNAATEVIHKYDELYQKTRDLEGEEGRLTKAVQEGSISQGDAALAAQKIDNAKKSLLTTADREHAAAEIEVASLRLNRQEREQAIAVWNAQLALSGKSMSDADRDRAILDAWTISEQKRKTAIADTAEDLQHQADATLRLAAAAAKGLGPLHDQEVRNQAFALALKAGAEGTDKFKDAYAKYIEQLQKDDVAKRALDLNKWNAEQLLAIDATQRLADATLKGGAAVAEANIQNRIAAEVAHLNDQSDTAAIATIEKRVRAESDLATVLKARQQLAASRDALEVAQLELSLADKAPEIRQREVEALKTKQQLLKDNIGLTTAEGSEILKNQTLVGEYKGKLAELNQQQSLWLEPFKNAIRGIQDAFASAFESIFSGGVRSFADLGHTVWQIMVKLAAQIAALLVFRPIVGSVVGAVPGMGGVANSLAPGGSSGGGFGLSDFTSFLPKPDIMSWFGGGSAGGPLDVFSAGGLFGPSLDMGMTGAGAAIGGMAGTELGGSMLASGAIGGGLEMGGATAASAGMAAGMGAAAAIPYVGIAIMAAMVISSMLSKKHPKNVTADMAIRQQPWLQDLQGLNPNVPGESDWYNSPHSLDESLWYGDRGSSNGADTTVFDPLAKEITAGFGQLFKAIGGTFQGFDLGMANGDKSFVGRIGYNSTSNKYGYQVGDQQFSADNLESAVQGLLTESIKHANITGISDTMATVLKNTTASTLQDLMGDISFGKQFERGFQQTSQYDQALEQLNQTYDATVQKAKDLGLSETVVNAARDRDAATLKANTMADLQVRQLVAQGRGQEADDLRRQIAQQQELNAEMDPAIKAEIARTQAIENATIVSQRAAARQIADMNSLSGMWATAYAARQAATQAQQVVDDAIAAKEQKLAQDKIATLNTQLQTQNQIAAAAKQTADALGQVADSLDQTRQGFLYSAGSPLSMGDQLSLAQGAFRTGLSNALAHPDDANAYKDLQNLATQYRQLSLAYNANNSADLANFQEIQSGLQQAAAVARAQQSIQQGIYTAAQTQVGLLQQQVDLLNTIANPAAPQGPTDDQRKAASTAKSLADFATLAAQVNAAHLTGNWKNVFTGADDFTKSNDYAQFSSQRDSIIASISDPAALFGLLNQYYAGNPSDPGALAIRNRLHGLGVQGFADGGITGRIAFVHPGEMVYTGPSARVFNRQETQAMIAGTANDRLPTLSAAQGAHIIDLLQRIADTGAAVGEETIRSVGAVAGETRNVASVVRQAAVAR